MATKVVYKQGKTEDSWRITVATDLGLEESASMIIRQPHDRAKLAHPSTCVHCTQDLGGLVSAHEVTEVASILLVALASDFDHIRFVLKSLLKVGKITEITGASSFLDA